MSSNIEQSRTPVVALLGDSWMARLSPDYFPQYQIHKFCKGGANARWFIGADKPQFTNFVEQAIKLQPDVAIIHMGGNDIKAGCNMDLIVSAIVTVFEKLKACGIVPFLSEIPIRTKCTRSNLSNKEYNKMRELINSKLKKRLQSQYSNSIISFPFLDAACLLNDGVHLSQLGYSVYVEQLTKHIDSHLQTKLHDTENEVLLNRLDKESNHPQAQLTSESETSPNISKMDNKPTSPSSTDSIEPSILHQLLDEGNMLTSSAFSDSFEPLTLEELLGEDGEPTGPAFNSSVEPFTLQELQGDDDMPTSTSFFDSFESFTLEELVDGDDVPTSPSFNGSFGHFTPQELLHEDNMPASLSFTGSFQPFIPQQLLGEDETTTISSFSVPMGFSHQNSYY